MKDPLYKKILTALEGNLDPNVFEGAMGDLLRDAFPSLVPVRGGSDFGFDGAIADGAGEPFPLVCTTGTDVIGNLTKNLDSVLKSGSLARKVVLATSQTLSPMRRRNLVERSREKGFTLVQVIDRSGIASRIYRNSRWLKELLGLTGAPSALSAVPPTRRPLLDLEPIGRETDLAWLKEGSGDRVLAGEPGSGKTFLVFHLIQHGWSALFLADYLASDGAIAEALRDQGPSLVVVDDAHRDPEILTRLVRLRRESQADFAILAVTWRGGLDRVIEALGGITESGIRRLELLTRDQILEVLKQTGLEQVVRETAINPDSILRELVDQSANKPGLAATISALWLQGAWQEILEGTTLKRNLLGLFHDLAGGQAEDVLAAFSLGGDRGMRMVDVGEFLRLSLPNLRQITANLEAGGVLSEPEGGALAVWPRQLRYALLRTVFFPGNGSGLPYGPLLERAVDLTSAIESLASSRLRGASIPAQELRALVAQTEPWSAAWQALAASGPEDALWALDHYPGDPRQLFHSALSSAPEEVIPRIFKWAEQEEKSQSSTLDILKDSIQGARWSDEALRRRWILARASKAYLRLRGAPSVGIRGICIALSPTASGDSLDPGFGRTVTIWSGLLPSAVLLEIGAIWEEVRAVVPTLDVDTWQHFSTALWDWLHPEYAAKTTDVAADQRDAMREVSSKLLNDLAERIGPSPGFSAELYHLSAEADIELQLPARDAVFELLYPKDIALEETSEANSQSHGLEELFRLWRQQPPDEVARQLALYEAEALKIRRAWTANVPSLCSALAKGTDNTEEWLDSFMDQGLGSSSIRPFLEKVVREQHPGWVARLEQYLEIQAIAPTAFELILQLLEPPPELLTSALEKAAELIWHVETICLRRQVPLATLRILLEAEDSEVALAAAIGEWCAIPRGEVRPEVLESFRDAILRAEPESKLEKQAHLRSRLGDILERDPDLAFHWLRAHLGALKPALNWFVRSDSPLERATRGLRKEHRIDLLKMLNDGYPGQFNLPKLVSLVVAQDADAFEVLLTLEGLRPCHLEPLKRNPDRDWEHLANLALQAGHGPREIAEAAFNAPHSWAGSGASYWQTWVQSFAELETRSDPALRAVGYWGRNRAQENLEEVRQREKTWEIRGLGVA